MVQKVIEFFRHEDKNTRDNRWIFGSMLVGSVLSLIAAFALSHGWFWWMMLAELLVAIPIYVGLLVLVSRLRWPSID